MTHFRALAAVALAIAAGACGGPESPVGELSAASKTVHASSVLRLPADGGIATLHQIPDLAATGWKAIDKLPAIERAVGADLDQGLVYAVDKKRNLVGLDLASRRVRPYLSQIRSAELAADGSLFAVDTGSAVTQLVRRSPVRFRNRLQGTPRALFATMHGTLLAPVSGKQSALEILGPDQQPQLVEIPTGPVTASRWGELIAVAADSVVALYDPQAKGEVRTTRVDGHARAVLFSPSGHRLYVAREASSLLVLDRFGEDVLAQIKLPGPAADLRGDLYGNWLLVRPVGVDSVWVVDPTAERYLGAVATRWADDLPVVTAPNTLLIRRDKDVVALDLSREGFPERGRVEGGAGDLWLPIGWLPGEEPGTQASPDSAVVVAADSAVVAGTTYLQVSSSQNPSWAKELADKLKAAGLPASVLPPARSDEPHRVVLGPYQTREQAEATGRTLGMPSFVITLSDGGQ